MCGAGVGLGVRVLTESFLIAATSTTELIEAPILFTSTNYTTPSLTDLSRYGTLTKQSSTRTFAVAEAISYLHGAQKLSVEASSGNFQA